MCICVSVSAWACIKKVTMCVYYLNAILQQKNGTRYKNRLHIDLRYLVDNGDAKSLVQRLNIRH